MVFGFSSLLSSEKNACSEEDSKEFSDYRSNIYKKISTAMKVALTILGGVGLPLWWYITHVRRNDKRANPSIFYPSKKSLSRVSMITLFTILLLIQLTAVEVYFTEKRHSQVWVLCGCLIQARYFHSYLKFSLPSKIYLVVAMAYLILRYQFLANWETQSFIHGIMLCAFLVITPKENDSEEST